MELTLGLKDLMYIGTTVTSVTVVISMLRNRVEKLEERMKTHNSTLFKKDASLNLINTDSCKVHRAEIDKELEKNASVSEKALAEIQKVNINIIKIAAHMKVDLEE